MTDDLSPDIEQSIDRAVVNARLEKMVEEMPCPKCGELGMTLTWQLTARPLGTFSLSGSQLKFSATEIPVIYCPHCGLYAEGNLGA